MDRIRALNAVGVKGIGAVIEMVVELERETESLIPCIRLLLNPDRGVILSLTNLTTDMNLPRMGAGSNSVARSCETRECE